MHEPASVHPPARIGLIRHFPVERRFPTGWKTSAELQQWRLEYESSPVILGRAELGPEPWAHCISSDIERAKATARAVFRGAIEHTALLREPEFAPFGTGSLRLPVTIWKWILMACWASGHASQRECRDDFQSRVTAAADLLVARQDSTLVVSHAVMMGYLSAELRRRGFDGPKLRAPNHATLHVYTRRGASGG